MPRLPLHILLPALAGFMAMMGSATADPHHGRERQEQQEDRGRGGISLDQAVAMAEKRFHARVVRADTTERDGHTVYVLRLLNDAGRVWTVQVDASNGSIR